ncbi:Mitogen-activated protein kinase kinase kinase, partial [Parasponia andersonii]
PGNNYQPPSAVMNTAAIPKDEDSPIQFYWTSSDPSTIFYVYMYFAELQQLEANESRAFNITLNGDLFYGPFVPDLLNVTTVFSPRGVSGGNITFSMVRLESSTLPPIFNAIEIYTLVDFSRSETEQQDVDAIMKIKSTYGVKKNWEGDPCLPMDYLWKGLNCSFDRDAPRITYLNLSSSGLTGEIASYISKLTLLQSLDLSNNSLTGSVPHFLTQLPNLRVLNLERNKLTGSVPAELIEKSEKGSLSLSVGENLILCASHSCETEKIKKKKNNVLIPVLASIGVVILLLIAVAIFVGIKRRPESKDTDSLESKKRQFAYSEVVKITNNFAKTLGKGGFGTVYHGFIDESTEVAVKMLSLQSVYDSQHSQTEEQERMQNYFYQQFQAEVKLLMRVHHGNLTSLVGYCNEANNKALIYEFMANGDLDSHLSGGENANVLSWEERLQIARDAAQGLEYLHSGCKPPIVHRDVKTT